MKVGDLIRYRMSWTHDENGEVVQPRLDEEGWSGPVLVTYEYPPPDKGLFICLENMNQICLADDECYDIEVINEP